MERKAVRNMERRAVWTVSPCAEMAEVAQRQKTNNRVEEEASKLKGKLAADGRLERGEWLDLLALERLAESPGARTVGAIPLPQKAGASIRVDADGVVISTSEEKETRCTEKERKKVEKLKESLLAKAPPGAREALESMHSGQQLGEVSLEASDFILGLRTTLERISKTIASGGATKERELRRLAVEELLGTPVVAETMVGGKSYIYKRTEPINYEFTMEEIGKRAGEIREEIEKELAA